MFSSRHQKFTCMYDVITIFYQQEHRSSFFLILPLLPLIFPFFFATLTKPAEANPSCRVAPNGFDPVSLSLSLASEFRRVFVPPPPPPPTQRQRQRPQPYEGPLPGAGTIVSSGDSPLAKRGARDLISRTRGETRCVYTPTGRVEAGAHGKRSAQRRSERIRACLPVCLAA